MHKLYYQYGEKGALENNPRRLLLLLNQGRRGKKATLPQVQSFLNKQPSYTVHRRKRPIRQRRKILVPASKLRIDADLIDLRDLSPWNSGYNYILVLIDAFTRQVWSEPLKNKEAGSAAAALKRLIAEDPEHLRTYFLYTDAGTEFTGAAFQALLKKEKIEHRICSSEDFHCPFVERVIRTLKEKLFQALTAGYSRRWVDLLPRIVATYNKTTHSSVGMSPLEAREPVNYIKVLQKSYPLQPLGGGKRRLPTYKYEKGDLVRIFKHRDTAGLDKGYTPNYTWEIFRIKRRANNRPHDKYRTPAYLLEDLNGEAIENAIFYESELVQVHPDQLKGPAPVREILAQKANRLLIWFHGHPKSSAVWVPRENLL